MKRLLLPLIAALVLPITVNALPTYKQLGVKTDSGGRLIIEERKKLTDVDQEALTLQSKSPAPDVNRQPNPNDVEVDPIEDGTNFYKGYEFIRFNDSLYLELDQSSWQDAQNLAEALGGNLVSINSRKEQEFIYENFIVNDNSGDIGKWIGFTDKDQEGNWVWTDGSTITYTNWNIGEPNNSRGYEDYGIIYGNDDPRVAGLWNDTHSLIADPLLYSGIVEIKLVEK